MTRRKSKPRNALVSRASAESGKSTDLENQVPAFVESTQESGLAE